MTSAIDSTFLTSINEAYPVAGVNNSTEGFRSNFARIKEGLGTAGKELTYLQDKQIEIVGDATGISGKLGNSLTQPDPIQLVLANSGVTAGTYTSLNNKLDVVVDAKGRVTGITATPLPTRPNAEGVFAVTASQTTAVGGNAKELTVPEFTVDEYGTITGVTTTSTIKIGLEGHPLAKGALLVGHETNGASVFVPPVQNFSPADQVVLAWKPSSTNPFGVAWFKLPAPPPPNPAKVIDITGGKGIRVSTDAFHPTVDFDITKFPNFPDNQAIVGGSKFLYWDFDTNKEYQLDVARVITSGGGSSGFTRVKDDLAPELGGNLELKSYKIRGNNINGIQLETRDSGGIIVRNVQTIDPNFFNPNDPGASVQLPEDQWVISEQIFPLKAPKFSSADNDAGIYTATMKIDETGQMYWSKEVNTNSGVQSIDAGRGIAFDPIGSITDTGSINIDFSGESIQNVDIYSDILVAMDANRNLYRNTIDKFTFTMPKLIVVDPVYGNDSDRPSAGQLADPLATIAAAISKAPTDSPDQSYILLLPGTYDDNFVIDRPNLHISSFMGPELTVVRGTARILADSGRVTLKGINFDIANKIDLLGNPILKATDGLYELIVEECFFYQDPSEIGRPETIITLGGTQTGQVRFDRCKFNGRLINNLVFDPTLDFLDSRVHITNTQSNTNNKLAVTVNSNTNTEISNVDLLWQVTHNGGILDVKNVSGIVGDYSDALWASIDPDVDDLESQGYVKEGIQSTASFGAKNFLALTNVSLRNFLDRVYYVTSSIQKTGSCQYTFSNVARKSDVDFLDGTRFDNHSMPKADLSDQVRKLDVNGTLSVDAKLSVSWDLTMTGNTSLVITGPITLPNAYADVNQAITLRVLVHQDSTGSHSLTWGVTDGTLIWDGGVAPTMPSAADKMMLVELVQMGDYWLGRKLVSN